MLCKLLEVGLDGIGLMFKDHEKLHRRYLVLVLLEMKRIIRIVEDGYSGDDDDDDDDGEPFREVSVLRKMSRMMGIKMLKMVFIQRM